MCLVLVQQELNEIMDFFDNKTAALHLHPGFTICSTETLSPDTGTIAHFIELSSLVTLKKRNSSYVLILSTINTFFTI